jgi:hypothetical protein
MNRFAYAIFCDDIRNEVNNKTSFMGIVGHLMYLPVFPIVLPKLCVSVTANTPRDKPFKSLSFKGFLNETILFEVELDADQLAQANQGQGQIEDPKGFLAQAMFVLSPLHIEGPGKIKISVIADGEDLDCPGLQLSPAPEDLQIV